MSSTAGTCAGYDRPDRPRGSSRRCSAAAMTQRAGPLSILFKTNEGYLVGVIDAVHRRTTWLTCNGPPPQHELAHPASKRHCRTKSRVKHLGDGNMNAPLVLLT